MCVSFYPLPSLPRHRYLLQLVQCLRWVAFQSSTSAPFDARAWHTEFSDASVLLWALHLREHAGSSVPFDLAQASCGAVNEYLAKSESFSAQLSLETPPLDASHASKRQKTGVNQDAKASVMPFVAAGEQKCPFCDGIVSAAASEAPSSAVQCPKGHTLTRCLHSLRLLADQFECLTCRYETIILRMYVCMYVCVCDIDLCTHVCVCV
jgi:hypothetical protein